MRRRQGRAWQSLPVFQETTQTRGRDEPVAQAGVKTEPRRRDEAECLVRGVRGSCGAAGSEPTRAAVLPGPAADLDAGRDWQSLTDDVTMDAAAAGGWPRHRRTTGRMSFLASASAAAPNTGSSGTPQQNGGGAVGGAERPAEKLACAPTARGAARPYGSENSPVKTHLRSEQVERRSHCTWPGCSWSFPVDELCAISEFTTGEKPFPLHAVPRSSSAVRHLQAAAASGTRRPARRKAQFKSRRVQVAE
uniref:Uncharacterized protein n=1 Tax=Macrostomum lignano TaxID=282301 RepID=A0A1I8ITX0_9PLAT